MNHKIIAVDCDEVLSETFNAALMYNNNKFKGTPITREDMTNYYFYKIDRFSDAKPQDTLDFYEPVINSERIRSTKRVQGAREKLSERKLQGYTLKVVTGRPLKRKKFTIKWLERHFTDMFSDVYFADHLTDNAKLKSEICKEIGATVIIEDNLDYCIDTAGAGILSFLIEKPRNNYYKPTIHKNIIKVSSRYDINLNEKNYPIG